jgi:hypothetical protein
MLRSFGEIISRAISYPAIAFWFSFLGAPSGTLGAVFNYMMGNKSASLVFPTPSEVLGNDQCRFFLRAGCAISLTGMGFVGRRVHVVLRHLVRRRRCHRACVILNDFLVVVSMMALGGLAILDFMTFPVVYGAIGLAYLFAALSFQILIDYAAATARRFVPMSQGINVVAGLMALGAAVTSLSTMESVLLARIGNALFMLAFVLVHLKYVFAGVNLLGAKFIPGIVRFYGERNVNVPRSSSSGSGFL